MTYRYYPCLRKKRVLKVEIHGVRDRSIAVKFPRADGSFRLNWILAREVFDTEDAAAKELMIKLQTAATTAESTAKRMSAALAEVKLLYPQPQPPTGGCDV